MLPLDRFLSFIKEKNLFSDSDRILLTVSGGSDSVLMVHLFDAAGIDFGIAHCNFHLRGAESDGDEAFVSALAKTLKVPLYVEHFDTHGFASGKGISIQMAARELRYAWFEKIRKEEGYHRIATAHHQSDTTETVLLNLVRGTGVAGLHGIKEKKGFIVRPLLFLSGPEVKDLVADNCIAFREDSSNLSAKYARNKLRIEVIPELKKINPYLDRTFAQNSERFEELEAFLTLQADALRKDLFRQCNNQIIRIDIHALKALIPLKLLLYEIFKPYGFSETVLGDLIRSWNGQPGKLFKSASHTMLLDREVLVLKERNEMPAFKPVFLEKGQSLLQWPGGQLLAVCAHPSERVIGKSPDSAFMDFHKLLFPLELRNWKQGDVFVPLGFKGRKKLSDYFTGKKLSVFEKEEVKVLANGNGEIVWIVGYRLDDRYKVVPETEKVFILERIK